MALGITSEYGGLFEGSARLGVLVAALEVPWTRVTPYVSMFSDELKHYQELSLGVEGDAIGLMTRGSGKEFAFAVCRYMEAHGVDQDRLRLFLVRARFLEYHNLFFKVEFGRDGPLEFSYYFRQPASLEVTRAWVSETASDTVVSESIDAYARRLGRRTVHFLGTAEGRDRTSVEKIYFSQPAGLEAFANTPQLGKSLGVNDSDWLILEEYSESLAAEPFFVSFTIDETGVLPGIKCDFRNVTAATTASLISSIGAPDGGVDRATLLRSLFDKSHFDYVGLRIRSNTPPGAKLYSYRSSTYRGDPK